MIRRYCNKCGKEIDIFNATGYNLNGWFTIIKHGLGEPIVFDLCDDCFCEVTDYSLIKEMWRGGVNK